MQYKPCYEDVIGMVNEASEQFGGEFELSRKKYAKLPEICGKVDELVSEFECKTVEVSVDEDTKRLTISVECSEMIVDDGRTHGFFSLIALVDAFAFSKSKKDTLQISFHLDRMWESV